MLGFVISRLLQAVVVVFAMSIIVFVGVYAIGNPIDVMIDPGATAGDPREPDRGNTASTSRSGGNT